MGDGEQAMQPRTRRLSSVNPAALDAIARLADESAEVRARTATHLATATQPMDPPTAHYVLDRLVRGCASSREHARPSFALALAALVRQHCVGFSPVEVIATVEKHFASTLRNGATSTKDRREAALAVLTISAGLAADEPTERLLCTDDLAVRLVRLLRLASSAEATGVSKPKSWGLHDAVVEVLERALGDEPWAMAVVEELDRWATARSAFPDGLSVSLAVDQNRGRAPDLTSARLIDPLAYGLDDGHPRPTVEPAPASWRSTILAAKGSLAPVWNETVRPLLLSSRSREKQLVAIALLPLAAQVASCEQDLESIMDESMRQAIKVQLRAIQSSKRRSADHGLLAKVADQLLQVMKDRATDGEFLIRYFLQQSVKTVVVHRLLGHHRIHEAAATLSRETADALLAGWDEQFPELAMDRERDALIDILGGFVKIPKTRKRVGRFCLRYCLECVPQAQVVTDRIRLRLQGLSLDWIAAMLSSDRASKTALLVIQFDLFPQRSTKRRKQSLNLRHTSDESLVTQIAEIGTRHFDDVLVRSCVFLVICGMCSSKPPDQVAELGNILLRNTKMGTRNHREEFVVAYVYLLVALSALPSASMRGCLRLLFTAVAPTLDFTEMGILLSQFEDIVGHPGGTSVEQTEREESDDDDDDNTEVLVNDEIKHVDETDEIGGGASSMDVDIDIDQADPAILAAFDAQVEQMMRQRKSQQQSKREFSRDRERQQGRVVDFFSCLLRPKRVSPATALLMSPRLLGIVAKFDHVDTRKKAAILVRRICALGSNQEGSLALQELEAALECISGVLRNSKDDRVTQTGISVLAALLCQVPEAHRAGKRIAILDKVLADAHERRKDIAAPKTLIGALIGTFPAWSWESLDHVLRMMVRGGTPYIRNTAVELLRRMVTTRGFEPSLHQRDRALAGLDEHLNTDSRVSEKLSRVLSLVELLDAFMVRRGYDRHRLCEMARRISQWDAVQSQTKTRARLEGLLRGLNAAE